MVPEDDDKEKKFESMFPQQGAAIQSKYDYGTGGFNRPNTAVNAAPKPAPQAQPQAPAPAYYGVQASGADPNQRGPSGFVSFNQQYQANKGAIDQRNAQMAGFLNNQAMQARQTAQGAFGTRGSDAGVPDALMARDAGLRSLDLMQDEWGRGALAEQALGGELSDFDRMLMAPGSSQFVPAAENLKQATGEFERQRGFKKTRDEEQAKQDDALKKRAEAEAADARAAQNATLQAGNVNASFDQLFAGASNARSAADQALANLQQMRAANPRSEAVSKAAAEYRRLDEAARLAESQAAQHKARLAGF